MNEKSQQKKKKVKSVLQWSSETVFLLQFYSLLSLCFYRSPFMLQKRQIFIHYVLLIVSVFSYFILDINYFNSFLFLLVFQSYIVYLGGHPQIPEDVTHFVAEERRKEAHYELLGTVLGRQDTLERSTRCMVLIYLFLKLILNSLQCKSSSRCNLLLVYEAHQWFCCNT